jgi:ankyrin repeat protein
VLLKSFTVPFPNGDINNDHHCNKAIQTKGIFVLQKLSTQILAEARAILDGFSDVVPGAGVSVSSEDFDGETPLFYVIRGSVPREVEVLILCGADVNKQQFMGLSPLHTAAMGRKMEIIELLLRAGANPSCKDNAGETPADFAEKYGDIKIADYLRTYVKVSEDQQGTTP